MDAKARGDLLIAVVAFATLFLSLDCVSGVIVENPAVAQSDERASGQAVTQASEHTHDLAIVALKVPKKVTLSVKKPTVVAPVTVTIQNRSSRSETIPDQYILTSMVSLTVEPHGAGSACPAPIAALSTNKSKAVWPMTLKPNKTVKIVYDVTFTCTVDPMEGLGHEDYRYTALIDASAIDGEADVDPASDVCPRPPIVDGNGSQRDKGCGGKLPGNMLGGPVLTDIVQKTSKGRTHKGRGWVTVSVGGIAFDEDGMAVARLYGDAFVADSRYFAHHCIGWACLFSLYDDSYPGVDITVTNLTTGIEGTSKSRFGTATDWNHYWSASVPVIFGMNNIEVTAADPAGNWATKNLAYKYLPLPPNNIMADSGDGAITLTWDTNPDTTTYRIYMATASGTAFPYGNHVDVTGPPYVHSGLSNGAIYYYVITSLHTGIESRPSPEVAATAGLPHRPTNLSANLDLLDVQLSWDDVPLADTYTLYWDNTPGVTKQSGVPIIGASSPYLHTSLGSLPYYYVVTASNAYGESALSEEVMAFPAIAPLAPTGLSAEQRLTDGQLVVDLSWSSIPGVDTYSIYRSLLGYASLPDPRYCSRLPFLNPDPWELVGTSAEASFADWVGAAGAWNPEPVYRYYVTATNGGGTSSPSDWIQICLSVP